mmetsp:Transcript_47292/g.96646  ORF Transcript_47292/g.96646 Transcript_47292/m.96646 type:complete len:222 (-) Transcript_47292:1928-2593(-)
MHGTIGKPGHQPGTPHRNDLRTTPHRCVMRLEGPQSPVGEFSEPLDHAVGKAYDVVGIFLHGLQLVAIILGIVGIVIILTFFLVSLAHLLHCALLQSLEVEDSDSLVVFVRSHQPVLVCRYRARPYSVHVTAEMLFSGDLLMGNALFIRVIELKHRHTAPKVHHAHQRRSVEGKPSQILAVLPRDNAPQDITIFQIPKNHFRSPTPSILSDADKETLGDHC